MACLRYGHAARAHKLHNYAPRFPLTHPAAVSFPQVQDEFCQLWQKTAADKCSPEPVSFTRIHLLLWHEPACVEKPTHAINVLGRVEQSREREQTNQESSCGRMLVPRTWRVFRCWFPGPGAWGESAPRTREGQHIPHPLPAPSLASPRVPSILLGSLL